MSDPDALSPARLELFVDNLKLIGSLNYVTMALLAVTIYDALLTMSREVRFIWRGGISVGKVLYLVARYYAIVSIIVIVKTSLGWNLSLKGCRAYINWFTSAGLQVEEAFVNMLLILRINALYDGQRKIFFFVLTVYIIEVALLVYAGVRSAQVVPLAPLPPGISVQGCLLYVAASPSFLFTLLGWIPALILSAILLGLSAYKIRDDVTVEAQNLWKFGSWNAHHPLLLAIFHQGVIFFIVNISITLTNAGLVIRIHNVLDTLAVPLGIVAYSICGCRFLLNFYELSNDSLNRGEFTDDVIVFEGNTGDTSFELITI